MDPHDGECIARCLNGHPDEFRFLVERYQGVLVSWLTGRLGDSQAAEDAAQEAFVRAWLGLGKFRSGKPFFPWLATIAVRVAGETLRAERRRDRRHRVLAQVAAGSAPASADEPDVELRRTVDALPERYRNVVLLRYYGQCSCKQVAERLDLPLGTVTKTLSRAHAMLRELLGRHAGGETTP